MTERKLYIDKLCLRKNHWKQKMTKRKLYRKKFVIVTGPAYGPD